MNSPQKRQAKMPEQIAAEKVEAERIREEIMSRINAIPQSVRIAWGALFLWLFGLLGWLTRSGK